MQFLSNSTTRIKFYAFNFETILFFYRDLADEILNSIKKLKQDLPF